MDARGLSLVTILMMMGASASAALMMFQSVRTGHQVSGRIRAATEADTVFRWVRMAVADPGTCANVIQWVAPVSAGQHFATMPNRGFQVQVVNNALPPPYQTLGAPLAAGQRTPYAPMLTVKIFLESLVPFSWTYPYRGPGGVRPTAYFIGRLRVTAEVNNTGALEFLGKQSYRHEIPITIAPNRNDPNVARPTSLGFCSIQPEHTSWIENVPGTATIPSTPAAIRGKSSLECLERGGRLAFEADATGNSVARCYFSVPDSATDNFHRFCPNRMVGKDLEDPLVGLRIGYALPSRNADLTPSSPGGLPAGFAPYMSRNPAEIWVMDAAYGVVPPIGTRREIRCR